MRRIIINGRFLTQRITGVQRYAREICAELDKLVSPDELIMAVPSETTDIPKYKNIKVVKVGRFHNRLWEHISFPLYVLSQKATSLNLCNVAPLISPGIVCIHDIKIKATPQFFSTKFLLWYRLLFFNATRRAKKIITVSNFSKSEIIKYYGVDENKIIVAPNGWQHFARINYDEDTLAKYGLEKDSYYFAMSSLEPNKNFKWIAEQAVKNTNDLYVVAGSINEKVFSEGLGFKCPDNMKLIGYVSDEEAKTLMRDCKAFLFPSIYEGFGIPPLEALSAGCNRVIVSDTDVMHEIFGDCVEYIDDEVNLGIMKRYSIKYTKVLERFSWNRSALLLMTHLKTICFNKERQ